MPDIDATLVSQYRQAIIDEFTRATMRYGPFTSEHEGYAVLLEEVDELWDAVKLKQTNPERRPRMEKECIQVAAMALRFLHDMRLREK